MVWWHDFLTIPSHQRARTGKNAAYASLLPLNSGRVSSTESFTGAISTASPASLIVFDGVDGLSSVWSRCGETRGSGSKKAQQLRIVAHGGRATLERDGAAFHYIGVARHPQSEFHVLLHEEYAHAAGKLGQTVCDLLDDADPHAFGRLIEH